MNTAQTKTEFPRVMIGQVWKEEDSRFIRFVEIMGIDGEKVKIKAIRFVRQGEDYPATNRITTASIKRFNGKHGGYSLTLLYGKS